MGGQGAWRAVFRTDLVKSPVFETSLSRRQDCSGDVHNRDLALDVRCTKAGADVACTVHEDAGTCHDQQRVICLRITASRRITASSQLSLRF